MVGYKPTLHSAFAQWLPPIVRFRLSDCGLFVTNYLGKREGKNTEDRIQETGGERITGKFSDSDISGMLPESAEIVDGFRQDFFGSAGEAARLYFDNSVIAYFL